MPSVTGMTGLVNRGMASLSTHSDPAINTKPFIRAPKRDNRLYP